jgi:sugar/nucleoside kinase (ribokinase family)
VILVVGDVADDVVVRALGPLAASDDTRAEIALRPGGSAANTAAWLGALGTPVRFAGRVGAGDAARHAAALEDRGVDARLSADALAPTGRSVVLAHDRSMFTDRGANARLSASDLPDALLDGVTHVHVSGYALAEPGTRAAVLGLVRRAVVPWSVDPGSAALVRAAPFTAWTAGAAVCFPNDDEAQLLGERAAYRLVVRKRGATLAGTSSLCNEGRPSMPSATAKAACPNAARGARPRRRRRARRPRLRRVTGSG